MSHTAIPTHMKALGVSWGASAQAVKDAWRKAAKAAHPDVAGEASTERMAQINAAYEALKDGVPSQEQAQRRAEGQARSASSSTSTNSRKRHAVKRVNLYADEHMRRDWRKKGYSILRQHKIHSRTDRILSKLLPGRSEIIFHVPISIKLLGGGEVEIMLDTERLHKGPNHVVIPHLIPMDGTLRGTGDVTVQIIRSKNAPGYLRKSRMKDMDDALLPYHNGLKVYLSTKH